jgi:hypothetical protein
MNGEVGGMAMLIDGGVSTGKKLLRFPLLGRLPPVPSKIDPLEGRVLRGDAKGKVDAEEGILDCPNSLISDSIVLRVGSVIAVRDMLILGRIP